MTSTKLSYAEIAQMLKDRAADFAPYILGEQPTQRTASWMRFYPKGGFVVHLTGRHAGRFTDHADDGRTGDMVDLICREKNLGRHEAIEFAKSWLGISDGNFEPPSPKDREAERAKAEADDRENQQKRLRTAKWLWSSSTDGHDAVIAYLRNRGIAIDKLPECVRARRLDETALEKMDLINEGVSGEIWAAVFGATNLKGEIRAVQQVLIHDGQKINKSFAGVKNPKRTNGLMEGAACKLGTPEDTLAFAEGPETGFSFHMATGIPTWILFGSKNAIHVEIPSTVKRIVFCVDIEEHGNGIAAALRAAAYWQSRGYVFELAMPNVETGDFNDVLQEKGAEAILESVQHSLKSPEGKASEAVILCEDPRDGLLAWQATGYTVQATVRPLNLNYHGPAEAPAKLIALATRGESIDTGLLMTRYPEADIRSFTVRSPTLRDAVPDIAGMADLIRFTTPAGKTALFGLSRLVGRTDNPVILCPDTADAVRAQKCSGRAVVAWTAPADACDFSPLAGRDIVIAARHSPEGQKEAAEIAALVFAAGASGVRILEWPLYAPKGAGHAIKYRQLPMNYTLSNALEDGWNSEDRIENLLEMAVAV